MTVRQAIHRTLEIWGIPLTRSQIRRETDKPGPSIDSYLSIMVTDGDVERFMKRHAAGRGRHSGYYRLPEAR